jgi:formate/nitrite transporter FocA (FNT family)
MVAGFAIGFSLLGEALLRIHLPDAPWRPLVENFGYSIGFLIVILGQMQLFTENTITPVCSVLETPTRTMMNCLARIWSVVFLSNVVGATGFAGFVLWSGAFDPELLAAMLDISDHATGFGWWETVTRGIIAGWLIAALVWLMPSLQGARALVIILITWLIALGDFAHVVAGSAEAMLLALEGAKSFEQATLGFIVPAFLGNVLGGSALFTILVWGQIRAEMPARPKQEE